MIRKALNVSGYPPKFFVSFHFKLTVILVLLYFVGGTDVDFELVLPGDRPDNKIMQYDSKDLLTSAEKYDSAVFIEKTHWGYYQWPLQIKTYVLHDKSHKMFRTREEMTDVGVWSVELLAFIFIAKNSVFLV